MILESAQILCTVLNEKGFETPYKSTHAKHPCTLWAATSFDNFQWLKQLAMELNKEYRFRYQKNADHKSIQVIKNIEPIVFESEGMTEFAQAMHEKYKLKGDPVFAYRRLYIAEKMGFARWKNRDVPKWIYSEKYKI